jgi:hypothetical protein
MFGIDWLREGVPVDKEASVLTNEAEVAGARAMVRARVTDDLMLEGGRRHSHADRDRGASTTMASVRRTTKTTRTGLPRKPWRASTDASNLSPCRLISSPKCCAFYSGTIDGSPPGVSSISRIFYLRGLIVAPA